MKMGAFLLFGRTKQSDLHRTAFRWQLGVVSKITELARSTINRGKFIDARRKIARTAGARPVRRFPSTNQCRIYRTRTAVVWAQPYARP
jgi:hypothetical protein